MREIYSDLASNAGYSALEHPWAPMYEEHNRQKQLEYEESGRHQRELIIDNPRKPELGETLEIDDIPADEGPKRGVLIIELQQYC